MGDLYLYANQLMFEYNDCAIGKDKLIEAIREIQDKKDNK